MGDLPFLLVRESGCAFKLCLLWTKKLFIWKVVYREGDIPVFVLLYNFLVKCFMFINV